MASRPLPFLGPVLGLMTIFALSSYAAPARAASAVGSTATPRVVDAVDESKLVTLAGQTHPLASPKFDRGAVADSLMMNHMYLRLNRSVEQESALVQEIQDLQDPSSSKYHHWLTADQLGSQYGPSQQDIEAVTSWLSSHGIKVNSVHKAGTIIDLSATAGQI